MRRIKNKADSAKCLQNLPYYAAYFPVMSDFINTQDNDNPFPPPEHSLCVPVIIGGTQ